MYSCTYWLKEHQESMDKCTGRRDITEIILETALNTIQSINNLFMDQICGYYLILKSYQISPVSNNCAQRRIRSLSKVDTFCRCCKPLNHRECLKTRRNGIWNRDLISNVSVHPTLHHFPIGLLFKLYLNVASAICS